MNEIDYIRIHYQRNPAVVCTELDDGAILLNLNTKDYYNINETGLRIWQFLSEPSNLSEMAEKILEEYEVDKERAMESVRRIIAELYSESLVRKA
jgi:hypothetical protein